MQYLVNAFQNDIDGYMTMLQAKSKYHYSGDIGAVVGEFILVDMEQRTMVVLTDKPDIDFIDVDDMEDLLMVQQRDDVKPNLKQLPELKPKPIKGVSNSKITVNGQIFINGIEVVHRLTVDDFTGAEFMTVKLLKKGNKRETQFNVDDLMRDAFFADKPRWQYPVMFHIDKDPANCAYNNIQLFTDDEFYTYAMSRPGIIHESDALPDDVLDHNLNDYDTEVH